MSTRARTRAASNIKTAVSKSDTKTRSSVKLENETVLLSSKSKSKHVKSAVLFCLCRKGDDGSPMVNCSECDEWYHFSCVDLGEEVANDINVYICPPCASTTGLRTVMLWEGPEAVEEVGGDKPTHTAKKPRVTPLVVEERQSDESGDEGSEDEYVAERTKPSKRRTRRLSFSEDSESEASGTEKKHRRIRKAGSPTVAPKSGVKRKAAPRSTAAPPSKRKRESSSDANDDPARAFCLKKLEVVFQTIFNRYPYIGAVEKTTDELNDEEKTKVEQEAKLFAVELERCLYETYSEFDKQGRPSAGASYKDRFRMLQFNLSKEDRTVLHRRIASGDISPKEISLMSTTDLANEQTKESIKLAEKEALEHSILEKTLVPRAKITHKGLEDIEVDSVVLSREREAERQREQEERRQRELEARQRVRTASMSMPPESPITPITGNWMDVPRNLPSMPEAPETALGPDANEMSAEPEMNLADLINIDDELGPVEATANPPVESIVGEAVVAPTLSPTGNSPFANNTPSFDLDALWTEPNPTGSVASPPATDDRTDDAMEVDNEPDDKDFDMFLEEKDPSESLLAAFEAKPQVWTGKICMPIDSTIPQETRVAARQIGGRQIDHDSLLWKTLFPTDLLRIDGRVPTDKSAQFLLQTRMNSSKELVAASFSPVSEDGDSGFQTLMDFLIAKGRHGLVFPWGSRPKDYHPGKELYMVPLLSSDAIPDFMEVLDNFSLPTVRTSNYLIGIWVLNKNKLATPPPMPPPVMTPAPPAFPPPAIMEPSTLAFEVAALTPEQVRLMLQTLTNTSLNPAPVPVPQPPQPQPQWGTGYPAPPPPPPHYGQQGQYGYHPRGSEARQPDSGWPRRRGY
ncbi:unnamed protein product [Mycena citricolor]|uniref:Transcription factor BYE1 n=1 Tax=Mycena citricolor TaxID=2018698 RepID=A0AAD2HZK4_9AGAR|nr:unnamed protein product [Mycena citricolor]